MKSNQSKPKGRESLDQKSRAEEKIGSGPHGKTKVVTQPKPGDGRDESLAKRGMSSEAGAKFWKESGYKVPTDVHGHHHPGKK